MCVLFFVIMPCNVCQFILKYYFCYFETFSCVFFFIFAISRLVPHPDLCSGKSLFLPFTITSNTNSPSTSFLDISSTTYINVGLSTMHSLRGTPRNFRAPRACHLRERPRLRSVAHTTLVGPPQASKPVLLHQHLPRDDNMRLGHARRPPVDVA